MSHIGDAVVRIEKIVELAERQVRLMDIEVFQKLLSRNQEHSTEKDQLPCFSLPVAENKRFFGREDVLSQLDDHLQPSSDASGIRSVALWGLGGVGKTQTALAYAYSKIEHLDAVFWIPAETQLSLQQGFSKVAIDALKIPGASIGAHQENTILVQTWLSRTKAKWLIVLDNVEDHQVLIDAWPAAHHGAILVTTRRRGFAVQPIDKGIELKEFSDSEGAEMLHHLLTSRKRSPSEDAAALEVSKLLNGYALAISQMVAYINSRGIKIQAFLSLYKKYPKKLHREKKPGWKYVGYSHALDTVWELSFESLDDKASPFLSVLSFLSPDSIPVALFEDQDSLNLSAGFGFCKDELALWDTIEQLTMTALVRNDVESGSLSLHRLVQSESLFRLTANERQEAFDAAVKLLLSKFPDRGIMVPRVDRWEEGLLYLPHISTIANGWHDSQQRLEPLGPTLDFCNLMANAAYFVEDNDTVGILSLAVNVASEAYKKLPEILRDKNLWADILELVAFRDLKEGAFDSCEQLSTAAYQIRLEIGQADRLVISNSYNLVGLACDSAGRHEDAKVWLDKAIDVTQGHHGDDVNRLASRNQLNLARNRYCVGDFEESERRCDMSMAAARKFNKTWNVYAFIYETYASLFRRSGDLERAKQNVDLAQEVLEEAGGSATGSWTAGICAYRAAEVAISQNRVQDAVEEAQKASTLARLYKSPIGTLARATHLLSRAYFMDPSREADAEQARRDAQRLRELLPPGRTNLDDESDEAYENLVEIIQR